ncbi:hypothetical protein [Sulfitobacter sp. JB4-11]|uniref:hypothetical protein n=1 Tax=Sulfitobacter rhodophyticola TaxID=3238304 RepID=UPI0035142C59
MSEFWERVFEYAIAIGLGVPATLLTLVFLHWIMSPKVRFSENIRHIYSKELKRPHYSIKVQKIGYFDLIDTTAVGRIAVQGINENLPEFWSYYVLPMSFSNSLVLSTNKRAMRLILPDVMELKEGSGSIIRSKITIGRPELGVRLEDIFMRFPDAYVQVQLIGHDSFSGVKKLYQSPKYRFHNIRNGKWNGMELEIDHGSQYA